MENSTLNIVNYTWFVVKGLKLAETAEWSFIYHLHITSDVKVGVFLAYLSTKAICFKLFNFQE